MSVTVTHIYSTQYYGSLEIVTACRNAWLKMVAFRIHHVTHHRALRMLLCRVEYQIGERTTETTVPVVRRDETVG